jgi:hypothetical protein
VARPSPASPGRVREAPLALRPLQFSKDEPFWRALLAEVPNPARGAQCLEILQANVALEPELLTDAAALVRAAASGRAQRDSEGLVTPVLAVGALDTLKALPKPLGEKVRALLDQTSSPEERAVLLKALATLDPGDPRALLAELRKTAKLIHGRPVEWLIENTTAYALDGRRAILADAREQDYCGQALALVAKAEAHPLTALQINLDPKGLASARSAAIRAQRKLRPAVAERAEFDAIFERSRLRGVYASGADVRSALREALLPLEQAHLPLQPSVLAAHPELLDFIEERTRAAYRIPIVAESGEGGGSERIQQIVSVSRRQGRRSFEVLDPESKERRWIGDDALLGKATGNGWSCVEIELPYGVRFLETLRKMRGVLGARYHLVEWSPTATEADRLAALDDLQARVLAGLKIPIDATVELPNQVKLLDGGHVELIVDCSTKDERPRWWRIHESHPGGTGVRQVDDRALLEGAEMTVPGGSTGHWRVHALYLPEP